MRKRHSIVAAFLATSAMALGLPPNAEAEAPQRELDRCCEESGSPRSGAAVADSSLVLKRFDRHPSNQG